MRNCIFKTITLALSLLLTATGFSQTRQIDSLKNILQTANEDSNKVNALNKLARIYIDASDTAKAIQVLDIAKSLSEKMDFLTGIGDVNCLFGLIKQDQNLYDEAITFYKRGQTNYADAGNRNKFVKTLNYIGACHYYLGNFPEAVKFFYEVLKLSHELAEKKDIGGAAYHMSSIYYYMEDYEESLKYGFDALKIFKELDNQIAIAGCYGLIAYNYIKQNYLTEALRYNSQGMDISLRINDNLGLADSYSAFSEIAEIKADSITAYLGKKQAFQYYSDALNNIIKANRLAEESGNNGAASDGMARTSALYLKINDLPNARKYAEQSLAMSKELDLSDNLKNSYLAYSKLDSAEGNYNAAYEHYKLYVFYKNKFLGEEQHRKISDTRKQYEFDVKEALDKAEQDKKEAIAKRTRDLQYGALIAVVLLAVFLFYNNRQKQKAKSKIESAYQQLKSTQAQLIQSEKMASLGQLTAGIAHEIQNPLNFVNNFSELNKELTEEANREADKGNIEEVKLILQDLQANSEKINSHGKRADAIVKGMLQHSRVSTGNRELTDINALADEYLRLTYHSMRSKDAQHSANKSFNAIIETRFDENVPRLNIIPQEIGTVLVNLYNNAFYAVKEKAAGFKPQDASYEPKVTVCTKKLGDGIEIQVRDNGNGIAPTIIDKIFQPFFTTKPTGSGTGLGLSLSYDIIKAHGGEIKVESIKNEYTQFTVFLPSMPA